MKAYKHLVNVCTFSVTEVKNPKGSEVGWCLFYLPEDNCDALVILKICEYTTLEVHFSIFTHDWMVICLPNSFNFRGDRGTA